MTGASSRSPRSSSWSRYWPMTSIWSPRWRSTSRSTTRVLDGVRRREPVALLRLGGGVGEPLGVGQRHPHLDAVGRCDVALRLDVLPRRVVALRADQREHVALAAVLAHQRRGEPEPAAGLQVGGHPEDRRRQQVHLVVDDEAPVARVEQLEVRVDALPAGRHHLVRRDGDRPDLLAGTGVLADLVLGQRGALEQLVAPLPGGDGVGDEDQRGRAWPGPSRPRRRSSCPRRRGARRRRTRRARSPRPPPAGTPACVQPSSRSAIACASPST